MRSRTARPVDHYALSSELVRALRGKRSQTAFSRRLGYRSNVIYGWESGRRWPSSSAFFAAARKTGIAGDADHEGQRQPEKYFRMGVSATYSYACRACANVRDDLNHSTAAACALFDL